MVSPDTIPSPSGDAKPGLSSLLGKAAETGREQRGQDVGAVKEGVAGAVRGARSEIALGIGAARERASLSWSAIKETGRKLAGVSKDMLQGAGKGVDVAYGVARNAEVRRELATYATDRMGEGRESLTNTLRGIREKVTDRKDSAVLKFQEKFAALRRGVSEKLVQPVTNRAKELRDTVVGGAKDGALFVAGTAVAGYETGKQAVESVKTTVTETKDAAVTKAKEWSGNVRDYFVSRADQVQSTLQKGRAEVIARYYEAQAAPAYRWAEMNGKFADMLAGHSRNLQNRAEQNRELALRRGMAAMGVRAKANIAEAARHPLKLELKPEPKLDVQLPNTPAQ